MFGPESTGKSTLARRLADAFDTVWVPRVARSLLEQTDGRIDYPDIERIARGQRASEDALARRANRVLIADTDLIATTIWSEVLFGRVPAGLAELAAARRADLYLLCDVDVAWVNDIVRYLPDERRSFHDRCRHALERHGCRYIEVRGDWEQRFARGHAAIRTLMAA